MPSRLANEAGFQPDRTDTVDLAGNLVIAIDQSDGAGLCPAFENLSAFERQILDKNHAVAIGESITVRIFYHAGSLRLRFARPLMPAGHALPFFRVFQHLVHLALGANLFAHRRMIVMGMLVASCACLTQGAVAGSQSTRQTMPRRSYSR